MPGIDFIRQRTEITMKQVLDVLHIEPVAQKGKQWHGRRPLHRSLSRFVDEPWQPVATIATAVTATAISLNCGLLSRDASCTTPQSTFVALWPWGRDSTLVNATRIPSWREPPFPNKQNREEATGTLAAAGITADHQFSRTAVHQLS